MATSTIEPTNTSSLAYIRELFSVVQSPRGHPPHYELIPIYTTSRSDRLDHLSILTPLSLIWRGPRVQDVSGVFYHDFALFINKLSFSSLLWFQVHLILSLCRLQKSCDRRMVQLSNPSLTLLSPHYIARIPMLQLIPSISSYI